MLVMLEGQSSLCSQRWNGSPAHAHDGMLGAVSQETLQLAHDAGIPGAVAQMGKLMLMMLELPGAPADAHDAGMPGAAWQGAVS